MGLFDKFKKKDKNELGLELYNEQELNELEEYIADNFGDFKEVFHEIASPDIHVDIAVIEPNEKDDYYKLMTMGMGAHRMNVPAEFDEYKLNYAELMICLPKEWDIQSDDENKYWPIRWLKSLARLPIDCDTWLGYGHTIAVGENHETLSDNNKFEGIGLVEAMDKNNESAILIMNKKKVVRFYQLVPLYGEEMDYKLKCQDIGKLLEKFDEKDLSFVVDINRRKY
ncbi:MAG: suppressor of fused domain protein [Coprobacillus sp.]